MRQSCSLFVVLLFVMLGGAGCLPLPLPPSPGIVLPESSRVATPTAYPLPTFIVPERVIPPEIATRAPDQEGRAQPFRPIRGELVAESTHVRLYIKDDVEGGYLPVDQEFFMQEAEQIYAYVSERLDTSTDRKFDVAFRPPDTGLCPVRGLAISYPDPQTILFVGEEAQWAYIRGVLAHEFGHLLHSHGLQVGGDRNLSEGLATWASGQYWEAWQGKLPEESVRTYLAEGTYISLHEYYRRETRPVPDSPEECLAQRDRRYTSWAAFLGYLIDEYGMEKLLALLESAGQQRDGERPSPSATGSPTAEEEVVSPPDFEGVYGQALNQLEAEWLRHLEEPTS